MLYVHRGSLVIRFQKTCVFDIFTHQIWIRVGKLPIASPDLQAKHAHRVVCARVLLYARYTKALLECMERQVHRLEAEEVLESTHAYELLVARAESEQVRVRLRLITDKYYEMVNEGGIASAPGRTAA